MGFSRMRVAYTAGEAIGPELFRFYRSLGINLKQLYGQTEASVYVCCSPTARSSSDTVGKPAPDVEIKIADSGEVLFRAPACSSSTTRTTRPRARPRRRTAGSTRATPASSTSAATSRSSIAPRTSGRLDNGALFAPKYLENKLKFYPDIRRRWPSATGATT